MNNKPTFVFLWCLSGLFCSTHCFIETPVTAPLVTGFITTTCFDGNWKKKHLAGLAAAGLSVALTYPLHAETYSDVICEENLEDTLSTRIELNGLAAITGYLAGVAIGGAFNYGVAQIDRYVKTEELPSLPFQSIARRSWNLSKYLPKIFKKYALN